MPEVKRIVAEVDAYARTSGHTVLKFESGKQDEWDLANDHIGDKLHMQSEHADISGHIGSLPCECILTTNHGFAMCTRCDGP